MKIMLSLPGISIGMTGLYLLSIWYNIKVQKQTQRISVLLPRDIIMKSCRNPVAFQEEYLRVVLIFAIITIAFSSMLLLGAYVWMIPIPVTMIGYLIFAIAILWFVRSMKKGIQKHWA